MPESLLTTPLDDTTALSQYARDRDAYAFEVLVHRYQAMVFSTCRRQLDNTADAEDATQETFLKLARKAQTIRTGLAGWLHACAVGTARDLARKRSTRRKYEKAASPRPETQPEPTWNDLVPEIDSAMQALPEKDRQLLAARFLAGRPQTELAAEANVSPPAIHQRIDRAIKRLRKTLRSRGVTVGATGLAAALGSAGAHAATVPAVLTGSLTQVGLAGIGSTGSTAAGTSLIGSLTQSFAGLGLSAKLAVIGLATAGGIGGVAVTTQVLGDPPAPATPPSLGYVANPVARTAEPGPTWFEGQWELSDVEYSAQWADYATVQGDLIDVKIPKPNDDGQGFYTLQFQILETDAQADPPLMKSRVVVADTPPGDMWNQLVGQDIITSYQFKDDALYFAMSPPGQPRPTNFLQRNDNRGMWIWRGVQRDESNAEEGNQDAPAYQVADGVDPRLAGRWHEQPGIVMVVQDGAMMLYHIDSPQPPEFQGEVLRVEEFDNQTFGVEFIITADNDPPFIGRRDRILVDFPSPDTMRYAHYQFFTPKHGEWPTDFEGDYSQGKGVVHWKRVQP